jgi:amidase
LLLESDPVQAFVDYPPVPIASAATGPLTGLTLAVKDLYDVVGYPTGGGHPLLRQTGGLKSRNAAAVEMLLAAGARFVGKTHTDEFAYSMNGENAHYGTPLNPRAAGRIPGGSSSGSAAAVAAGLVDIALGSDTGGSIRLPASYCGLIGLRTSHGRMSLEGVQPLAPSFDTVGWFARDLDTYSAIAGVLLGGDSAGPVQRLLIAEDMTEFVVGGAERSEAERCFELVSARVPIAGSVRVADGAFEAWRQVFRTIQAYEAWQAHGRFIETRRPTLGHGIRERFEWARTVSTTDYETALREREAVRRHVCSLVPPGTALLLPSAPSVAPVLGRKGEELEAYRVRAISLMCPAGLAGLPQLSLPMGTVDGLPFGISLLGWANADLALLTTAKSLLEPAGH